jgi:predicted ATP-grasp superfamily ATP-dependent carboligase
MFEAQQRKSNSVMLPPGECRILVIGLSVRAFVESAVRSQYRVIALDAFGDADLRSMATCYSLPRDFRVPYSPDALFEASLQLDFHAVAYTSNLENHPEILQRFEVDHPIAGNLPESVRAVRNQPALFSRLRAAGFPVPEMPVMQHGKVLDIGRRWLVKPVKSGGGHGIFFLQGQSPEKETLVQEHIPGKPCSASFIANGSESVLLGITEQLIGDRHFGARDFRYCGNILPLTETLEPAAGRGIVGQVRKISEFLVREFGLTGINGFDFVLNRGEVYPIEVNPRYSASMELVERAYNLPIFQLHMEAVADRRLPDFGLESQLSYDDFFGKCILFCEKDSVTPEGLDLLGCDLRDIPNPGQPLRKGSPVCTLLATGKGRGATYDALYRQAGLLKGRIYG